MELIREIPPKADKRGRNKRMGVFRCCICKKEVERELIGGKKMKACSRQCGGILRRKHTTDPKYTGMLRGRKVGKTDMVRLHINQPDECIGCGYWGRWSSSDNVNKRPAGYGWCRYILIEGHSRGDVDCHKEGIYTTEEKVLEGEEI